MREGSGWAGAEQKERRWVFLSKSMMQERTKSVNRGSFSKKLTVLVYSGCPSKYRRLGAWRTEIHFLMVLKAAIQDQSALGLGFSWGLCPWLLATCSPLCPRTVLPRCTCVPGVFSISCKDTSHIIWGPTLRTSFQLNHLFKDFVSKYNWNSFWGAGNFRSQCSP